MDIERNIRLIVNQAGPKSQIVKSNHRRLDRVSVKSVDLWSSIILVRTWPIYCPKQLHENLIPRVKKSPELVADMLANAKQINSINRQMYHCVKRGATSVNVSLIWELYLCLVKR